MNDDLPRQHAANYHAALKRLREENEQKEQHLKELENAKGLVPTKSELEKMMGGPKLSEEEIHRKAQDIADQRIKEQQVLERNNLVAPPTKSKLEAFLDGQKDELQKVKEEEQRQKENQQEQELIRKKDEDGRSRGGP